MKFNVIMILDGEAEKEIGEMTAAEVKEFIELIEMSGAYDEEENEYGYNSKYFDIAKKAFYINMDILS